MTPNPIPALTRNDGTEMPALGYGVFQTPPQEAVEVVTEARRTGYGEERRSTLETFGREVPEA